MSLIKDISLLEEKRKKMHFLQRKYDQFKINRKCASHTDYISKDNVYFNRQRIYFPNTGYHICRSMTAYSFKLVRNNLFLAINV